MPSRPTALDLVRILEQIFDLMGPAAFGVLDVAFFHSGPDRNVIKEIFGRSKVILDRAKKNQSNFAQTTRLKNRLKTKHALNGGRLEDARIGGALDALAIYGFFKDAYDPDRDLGRQEADKVWKYLSRKFAESVSGKIQTRVCGAAKDRVFFTDELPALVRNDKIDTINNIPWEKIRDAYFSDPIEGPDRAFKLICKGEMRLAWDRARTEATKPAVKDFFYTREYYRAWQRKDAIDKGNIVRPIFRKRTLKEQKNELAALTTRLVAAAP